MNIQTFKDKVNTIIDELLSSKENNPSVSSAQVYIYLPGTNETRGIKGVEYIRSASTGEWQVIIVEGTEDTPMELNFS